MTTVELHGELSFGQYLSHLRIKKGLRLEDISEKTKISIEILRHIEQENHEMLPDLVFMKGFIKAYAEVLQLEGPKVVERYLNDLAIHQAHSRAEAALLKNTPGFWIRCLLSLMLLFLLIFFSIHFSEEKQTRTDPPPPSPAAAETKAAPTSSFASSPMVFEAVLREKLQGTEMASPAKNDVSSFTEERTSENQHQHLSIRTLNETWIKIIIDSQSPVLHQLKAGQKLDLEAKTDFNLLIGDAGAVQIRYNHKPVILSGKKGQVITIKLPH